jgi:8-oxo-dGTP pyrophosphatase MutT (NUDIX family)
MIIEEHRTMAELSPAAPLPAAEMSMTLLSAGVIVHDRRTDRVLLLRRGPKAKFGQGQWDLPVGKNDPGETVLETAVRELEEETGLLVQPQSLRLAQVVHGAWGVEAPNGYVGVIYTTSEWSGELVNAEPEKHDRLEWFDVGALPEPFVPVADTVLAGYLGGGPAQVLLSGWEGVGAGRPISRR